MYKRKTIPYGRELTEAGTPKRFREYEEEVYIREMNFALGGIGCAAWDASVILGHWIRTHPDVFYNRRVHELGAGVGLPGLLAARYAKRSIMSDYVPELCENLEYEIHQNSLVYQEYIANFSPEDIQKDKQLAGKGLSPDHDKREQFAFNIGRSAEVQLLNWLEFKNMLPEHVEKLKADIILGSELSYIQNSETLDSLLHVINELLSEDGVFYLIQSEDRGTSHIFIDILQNKYNFNVQIHEVPPHVLDFYSTGQLRELYRYYTFSRSKSSYPAMKYDYSE